MEYEEENRSDKSRHNKRADRPTAKTTMITAWGSLVEFDQQMFLISTDCEI